MLEMIFYDYLTDDLCEFRDGILDEFLLSFPTPVRPTSKRRIRSAVNCVLYNVVRNVMQGIQTFPVTLNKQAYSNPIIINGKKTDRKISHKYVRGFIDWLVSDCDCVLDVGGEPIGVFKVEYSQSMLTVSDILVEQIRNIKLKKTAVQPLDNVVLLRDENKRETPYRLNQELRTIIDNLNQYNELSKQHDIVLECEGKSYDLQLVKIYSNKSFEQGGRLYFAGVSPQQLPESVRKGLTVAQEPVCELDYATLHVSIIRDLLQLPRASSDVYEIFIDGYDDVILRKMSKVALLIMINSKSLPVAKRAFNAEIGRSFDVDQLYKDRLIPCQSVDTGLIIDRLSEHNIEISEWFFSGKGLYLQHLDSKMADHVVNYFTQRGEIVIPVHDSFIVRKSLQKELETVMVNAYNHVLGVRTNCRVERK